LNYQKDFPVFNQGPLHYLDTAASSLTPSCVIDAMNAFYREMPVNVHRGAYHMSHLATKKYEAARVKVSRFINAEVDEVIFTSGASHGLNLVAYMLGERLKPGDEIITSELEHHSNFLPWQRLVQKKGIKLVFIPLTDAGEITLVNVKSVLTPQTRVIAIHGTSNTYGYTPPLKAIKSLVGEEVMMVVDGAQWLPHEKVDVKALNIDFLAISGHKMFGPNGIGVLYGKRAHLEGGEPMFVGGEMNDFVTKESVTYKEPPQKFETGTPPIAEAIGLGAAIDYIESIGYPVIHQHTQALKQKAIKEFQKRPEVKIYNADSPGSMILFNIEGVHPHDAVTAFDQYHVAIRAGHHCAQLLMKWLKVPATLRASFYLYNTEEDVEALVKGLDEAIAFFKGAFQ
jgi:cysteine desulfurase/selenocysteine lyase